MGHYLLGVCVSVYIYVRASVCVPNCTMHIHGFIVFKYKKIGSYMEKVTLSDWAMEKPF